MKSGTALIINYQGSMHNDTILIINYQTSMQSDTALITFREAILKTRKGTPAVFYYNYSSGGVTPQAFSSSSENPDCYP